MVRGGVSTSEPNDLRRVPEQRDEVEEICIKSHDVIRILGSILPDLPVCEMMHFEVLDVLSKRIVILEKIQNPIRDVLIEKQPHEAILNLCSFSAA